MPYTTAQLDNIVTTLEASLGKSYASITHEGKIIVYRSGADIRAAIAYFAALYPSATDAPNPSKPKVRTFFFFGGKGIGL
ncbi:MAG: hypothetical protein WDO73_03160 [Ignavibacteriota bacterium]